MQENYYEEQIIKDQKYQNIAKEQSNYIDCTFENCSFEDCIIIDYIFVNCISYPEVRACLIFFKKKRK